MSDQNDQQPAAGGAQSSIGVLPINILAQYLKDLSFENPRAPQSLVPGQPAPDINVQVDVQSRGVGEGVYEVLLSLRIEAHDKDAAVVFLTEAAYAGLFALPELPPEQLKPILLIEGPRLLFPFLRQIVADSTRNGGYPPLLLNPIDFVDLYRRQVEGAGKAH
jgi:preprotein translocase subunit SecB